MLSRRTFNNVTARRAGCVKLVSTPSTISQQTPTVDEDARIQQLDDSVVATTLPTTMSKVVVSSITTSLGVEGWPMLPCSQLRGCHTLPAAAPPSEDSTSTTSASVETIIKEHMMSARPSPPIDFIRGTAPNGTLNGLRRVLWEVTHPARPKRRTSVQPKRYNTSNHNSSGESADSSSANENNSNNDSLEQQKGGSKANNASNKPAGTVADGRDRSPAVTDDSNNTSSSEADAEKWDDWSVSPLFHPQPYLTFTKAAVPAGSRSDFEGSDLNQSLGALPQYDVTLHYLRCRPLSEVEAEELKNKNGGQPVTQPQEGKWISLRSHANTPPGGSAAAREQQQPSSINIFLQIEDLFRHAIDKELAHRADLAVDQLGQERDGTLLKEGFQDLSVEGSSSSASVAAKSAPNEKRAIPILREMYVQQWKYAINHDLERSSYCFPIRLSHDLKHQGTRDRFYRKHMDRPGPVSGHFQYNPTCFNPKKVDVSPIVLSKLLLRVLGSDLVFNFWKPTGDDNVLICDINAPVFFGGAEKESNNAPPKSGGGQQTADTHANSNTITDSSNSSGASGTGNGRARFEKAGDRASTPSVSSAPPPPGEGKGVQWLTLARGQAKASSGSGSITHNKNMRRRASTVAAVEFLTRYFPETYSYCDAMRWFHQHFVSLKCDDFNYNYNKVDNPVPEPSSTPFYFSAMLMGPMHMTVLEDRMLRARISSPPAASGGNVVDNRSNIQIGSGGLADHPHLGSMGRTYLEVWKEAERQLMDPEGCALAKALTPPPLKRHGTTTTQQQQQDKKYLIKVSEESWALQLILVEKEVGSSSENSTKVLHEVSIKTTKKEESPSSTATTSAASVNHRAALEILKEELGEIDDGYVPGLGTTGPPPKKKSKKKTIATLPSRSQLGEEPEPFALLISLVELLTSEAFSKLLFVYDDEVLHIQETIHRNLSSKEKKEKLLKSGTSSSNSSVSGSSTSGARPDLATAAHHSRANDESAVFPRHPFMTKSEVYSAMEAAGDEDAADDGPSTNPTVAKEGFVPRVLYPNTSSFIAWTKMLSVYCGVFIYEKRQSVRNEAGSMGQGEAPSDASSSGVEWRVTRAVADGASGISIFSMVQFMREVLGISYGLDNTKLALPEGVEPTFPPPPPQFYSQLLLDDVVLPAWGPLREGVPNDDGGSCSGLSEDEIERLFNVNSLVVQQQQDKDGKKKKELRGQKTIRDSHQQFADTLFKIVSPLFHHKYHPSQVIPRSAEEAGDGNSSTDRGDQEITTEGKVDGKQESQLKKKKEDNIPEPPTEEELAKWRAGHKIGDKTSSSTSGGGGGIASAVSLDPEKKSSWPQYSSFNFIVEKPTTVSSRISNLCKRIRAEASAECQELRNHLLLQNAGSQKTSQPTPEVKALVEQEIRPMIGFDMEWYSRGQHESRVALIQICSGKTCAMFRLSNADKLFTCRSAQQARELFPTDLRKLIEDPKILKCGVGILGDKQKLRKDFRIQTESPLETSFLVHDLFPQEHYPDRWSLKIMAQEILEVPLLAKTKNMAKSNWARFGPLTEAQIEYASDDARASLYVVQEIIRRGWKFWQEGDYKSSPHQLEGFVKKLGVIRKLSDRESPPSFHAQYADVKRVRTGLTPAENALKKKEEDAANNGFKGFSGSGSDAATGGSSSSSSSRSSTPPLHNQPLPIPMPIINEHFLTGAPAEVVFEKLRVIMDQPISKLASSPNTTTKSTTTTTAKTEVLSNESKKPKDELRISRTSPSVKAVNRMAPTSSSSSTSSSGKKKGLIQERDLAVALQRNLERSRPSKSQKFTSPAAGTTGSGRFTSPAAGSGGSGRFTKLSPTRR